MYSVSRKSVGKESNFLQKSISISMENMSALSSTYISSILSAEHIKTNRAFYTTFVILLATPWNSCTSFHNRMNNFIETLNFHQYSKHKSKNLIGKMKIQLYFYNCRELTSIRIDCSQQPNERVPSHQGKCSFNSFSLSKTKTKHINSEKRRIVKIYFIDFIINEIHCIL